MGIYRRGRGGVERAECGVAGVGSDGVVVGREFSKKCAIWCHIVPLFLLLSSWMVIPRRQEVEGLALGSTDFRWVATPRSLPDIS